MGCRVKGMTTQEYRRSYNYRDAYFRANPGIFGCVWFCSQCFKPLFGKKNVYVDHIVPLNKGGRNHESNCTAICFKCNRDKSDKVDGRVIKGKVFKIFESTTSKANKGVGAIAGLGVGLTAGAVSGAAHLGGSVVRGTARAGARGTVGLVGLTLRSAAKVVSTAASIVTLPIRKGTFLSRLCFVGIYALAVMYFLQEHTAILDAWLT